MSQESKPPLHELPDLPLVRHAGHKTRSGRAIVDRSEIVTDAKSEGPNHFTGPTFRNQRQRFRFDGHKLIYHLDRLEAWQRGERIAPIHIDMGLTKFCNTACIYCYGVVQKMERGTMIAGDALLRFVEDCGAIGVRSLGFIGDGEPTLNPALAEATALAASLGVDTAMATNGLKIDPAVMPQLLRDMSWIRVNLSAGDATGFQRVHQSHSRNFDQVVDNVRELVRLRNLYGYACTIGLQMVLVPECYDQIIKEAELGAALGVDYFVIKHCSDSEYGELGVNYEDFLSVSELLREAESLSNDNYVVQAKWHKINSAGESDLYKAGFRKYDVCYGTPFLLQISGNGKVYPCGPFFNKDRFLIGDLHTGSFREMVASDHYWRVHQDIVNSVDVHKDCAMGCRQDYLNRFLWDLKNPPEHLNFI
ncbi:MAG: radical SAM protein [Gammaproteobacteria bacterium]|nr:radical SAM protein [Gammaproteobacteria bacterium]